MEPNTDNDELPEIPDLTEEPLDLSPASAFDAPAFAAPDLGPPLGDDDTALKKMGRGTPVWAWLAFVMLLVCGAGAGYFFWQSSVAEGARWDAYNAAQEEAADEADFLRRIRELLPQTEYADVQRKILEKMAQYRDAESVPQIADVLRRAADPQVRTEAARTLAAIGSPGADSAKPVLLEVMPRATVGDRAAIVWALAVLGESAAADAIIEEFSSGHLQGQPNFDPLVISNVLGPERLSSNELLNHAELSVRTLTAAALAETATPAVVDPLTRMVDFELARGDHADEHVLRSIASGLGRAGDERAGGPLFRILTSQPRMRGTVLDSLKRTVGAPGIAALLPSATDEGVKRELVRMLSNSHDPRAAEPLAGQLASADEEIKELAAFGLAELGDARALPVLLTLAQGDDLTVGREALSKIQHLGSEHAVDGLLAMLQDERFLGRKANILRALGTSGAAHAGPAIERELAGDDVASAAAALADLNYEPSYSRLLRMIPRGNVDFSTPSVANETAFMNRTAAVRAIGRYRRPDAIAALITIVEDPLDDRRLRQDAGMALGAIATDEALTTIVGKLRDPALDEVAKRYYLAALWQRPSRALSTALLDLIASPDTPPDVKMSMALAIGYAADPAADERIGAMLADPALVERAAFAVLLGGSDANARALLAVLPQNQQLQDAIVFSVRDDESNAFNLITNAAFESGEIWRRLSVAHILNEGAGNNRYGFVWNHLIGRLRVGWDGHDGLTPRQIRNKLWEALRGDDPARRVMVTRVLATMDERGLLMASRDQAGPGSEEAREQLRRLNAVAQQD